MIFLFPFTYFLIVFVGVSQWGIKVAPKNSANADPTGVVGVDEG